jgi:hypothetical protein
MISHEKKPIQNAEHRTYWRRKRFLHWLAITNLDFELRYIATGEGIVKNG